METTTQIDFRARALGRFQGAVRPRLLSPRFAVALVFESVELRRLQLCRAEGVL